MPAFYLAQFTVGGGRESPFYVLDQKRLTLRESNPNRSGFQNNFYSADLGPTEHPSAFESKVLNDVDGKLSSVVQALTSTKRVPSGEDLEVLVNFVATSMTRTPRTRRLIEQVAASVANNALKQLVAKDVAWDDLLSAMPSIHEDYSAAELETIRKLILDGGLEIQTDTKSNELGHNTWAVSEFMRLTDGAIPMLADRFWSVRESDGTCEFVCSDNPVSLWDGKRLQVQGRTPLTDRATTLYMPLSRELLLVGSYDVNTNVAEMRANDVMRINSLTIRESDQIFTAKEDFRYLGENGQPLGKDELLRDLKNGSHTHDNLHENLAAWLLDRSVMPRGTKD